MAPPASSAILALNLVAGRSVPLTNPNPITKVTVANPLIADVVLISETEVVINGILAGETDIILWSRGGIRRHYRATVRSSADRQQILVSVKFAEIRRDALRDISTSLRLRADAGRTRTGTGEFRNDESIGPAGNVALSAASKFLTVLTAFNTRDLLGLINAEETRGNARFLAEPTMMAANREEASFLAGGEVPIPIVQGAGGMQNVSIMFREFGIRLNFTGEILSDSLIKIKLKPEVSSLDFSNAITISGFRIPALRTRRVETTVDVMAGRSLIISGLFNEEREQVTTGLPWLVRLPGIGKLFASTRWQKNESELIVIITPLVLDPNNPRDADQMQIRPDSTIPAREALEKRFWPNATVKPATRP